MSSIPFGYIYMNFVCVRLDEQGFDGNGTRAVESGPGMAGDVRNV